jgi:hypothetical protein
VKWRLLQIVQADAARGTTQVISRRINMIARDSVVELQMEEDEISFVVPSEVDGLRRLQVGAVAGVRLMLEKGHLTGPKIEATIDEIEELLMPALRHLPGVSHLLVSGPELEDVMRQLASNDGAVSISTVEALFNQVAAIATGSPARLQHIPTDPGFVLALVLLREVMHHGGFSSVSLLPKKS